MLGVGRALLSHVGAVWVVMRSPSSSVADLCTLQMGPLPILQCQRSPRLLGRFAAECWEQINTFPTHWLLLIAPRPGLGVSAGHAELSWFQAACPSVYPCHPGVSLPHPSPDHRSHVSQSAGITAGLRLEAAQCPPGPIPAPAQGDQDRVASETPQPLCAGTY